MARISLQTITSNDKPVNIQFDGATPTVSSREIALHFQKKHSHVLAEIKRIQQLAPKEFSEPNFRFAEYQDSQSKPRPCFHLTRDAFSLLAMGFTGKAAILWKLRYIEAFNALEAHALELARQAGYQAGLENGVTPLALETAEKQSYLCGLQDGIRQQSRKDRMRQAERMFNYLQKGLNKSEIAKLLDCSESTVYRLLYRLKALTQTAKGC